MNRKVWLWIGLVVTLVMTAASGCRLLPSRAQGNEGGATFKGVAVVESIEVLMLESLPIQVQVQVRGNLPDGCTQLEDATATREGRLLRVKLPTVRPADEMCTEALVPFEVTFPLDVEGLAAGSYTVEVNSVIATFELPENEEPASETPTPSAESPCELLRREGEAVFTNPEAAYCVRFPEGFTVTEPEPNVVVIHGPDHGGGGPEPLGAYVNIQAWEAAGGRTLEEVAADVYARFTGEPGFQHVERFGATLSGMPAVELTHVPGLHTSRHIVSIFNDRVVHLVFAPSGEVYGQAAADMLTLYESVTRSFAFLPADEVSPPPTQASKLAQYTLMQTLGSEGLAGAEVEIVSVEPVQWPDACLGLADEGEMCAAVIAPGYRVTLAVGDATYVYHTDETGGSARLASAPPVAIAEPVLTWQHTEPEGCRTAVFGMEAAAVGRCGGARVTVPLVADDLTRNLPTYVETYAPFTAETVAGTLVFTGTGSTLPTPAEQRMIAEFARVGSGIVASGHAGASYGFVLGLHRGGGLADVCEDFAIYVTGEVWITSYKGTSCKGETPTQLAYGRLTATEMDQLFRWTDTLESFEWTDTSEVPVDGLMQRGLFSGHGPAEAADDDYLAMQALVGEIYARLVTGDAR